nr:hypothetical protein [Granulicella tundricola]
MTAEVNHPADKLVAISYDHEVSAFRHKRVLVFNETVLLGAVSGCISYSRATGQRPDEQEG